MSKTIDVEGWPPGGGGKGRGGRPSRLAPGGKPPVLVMAAGIVAGAMVLLGVVMGLTGNLGVRVISPEEVGVLVNYVTGKETVVTTPGYQFYVPFLEEVYTLDRRTQNFVMQGNRNVNRNHVPLLTVRASDGSNFRIDDLQIQYELIPGDAQTVLHDSGAGESYKEDWIKGYARSILRDEFGRYSAVEVADPTIYKQAPERAKARMNQMLEPHGIRVILIKTPNPTFDDQYELAIESRKEADQEVERLKEYYQQLEQERSRRLATVQRQKSVEMEALKGELEKMRLNAERDRIEITKGAEAFAIQRVAEGQAAQAQRLAEAQGLEEKYRKEAEGIQARAAALEERGEVVVREAIIEKLASIRFTLVPYSRDPAPTRLEHSDAGGASARLVDEGTLGGNR